MRSAFALLPVLGLAFAASGCAAFTGAGARLFTKNVDADGLRIERDLAYRTGSANPKHRLDVYTPAPVAGGVGKWPVVVFVHGGGWTTGEKDLSVGGFEPYHNLARLLAGQGIAVALVNYRLLDAGSEGGGRPASGVAPEAQVEDVAAAVAWVRGNAARYGADANRLFVMGHSAGGQLAARVALDNRWLTAAGSPEGAVCGAVLVSGAGLDLTDVPSIRKDYRYFASRFADPGTVVAREMPAAADAWQREASPATYVTRAAPPFRLFVASGEKRAFRQQAERLRGALVAEGIDVPPVGTFGAPAHAVGALTMSRPGRIVGRETVAFVKGTACASR